MYEKINMVIPDPDVDRLETLGDTFTSYAEALISAEGKISQVIASILEYNSGPAAHQFQLSETSVTSIHSHVQSLIPAGRNTARAYLESAAAAKYAVTTLDGLNQRYDESYNQAVRGGIGKEDEAFITLLVEEASKTMKAIESWATNKINSLFEDVVLPDPFLELMSREDIYKHVDQRIAEEFNEIARNDPERAKRILQKVADDFADSHGLERIPLSFDEADFSNDKVKNSGGYCQVDDNGRRIKIALNPKTLGSAVDKTPRDAGPVENWAPYELLGAVEHEMEHLYQNSGKYDSIPSSMEAEEKARWKRLFQDHLNDKGYAPKPVEVDAREKGRNFANQMSYKDFEELCNQVP